MHVTGVRPPKGERKKYGKSCVSVDDASKNGAGGSVENGRRGHMPHLIRAIHEAQNGSFCAVCVRDLRAMNRR